LREGEKIGGKIKHKAKRHGAARLCKSRFFGHKKTAHSAGLRNTFFGAPKPKGFDSAAGGGFRRLLAACTLLSLSNSAFSARHIFKGKR
jgi:hypothetical protein